MSKEKIITAIFDTRAEAEIVLNKLERAGLSEKEVMLLITEETKGKHFGIKENTLATTGATAGATIGGLTGALFLGLASAGTLLVPGLNLVVSGALVGSLVGLGVGATTGGLVGALVGLGIPEHEAMLFEDAVRKGAILMAVDAKDSETMSVAMNILKKSNAQNITCRAA